MKSIRIFALSLLFGLHFQVSAQDMGHNNTGGGAIVIGASYAKDWPVKSFSCLDVVNKGIGGQVSTQVAERFNVDVLSGSELPKFVIIWGFINDIHNNPKTEVLKIRAQALENIKQMAMSAQKQGVIPVLATEVTLGLDETFMMKVKGLIASILGKQSYHNHISENVKWVNEQVKQFAQQNGFLVLDIEGLMTKKNGNRKEGFYKEDGSHITPAAYTSLTEYATPLIEQELIAKQGMCN